MKYDFREKTKVQIRKFEFENKEIEFERESRVQNKIIEFELVIITIIRINLFFILHIFFGKND